MSSLAIFCSFK